MKREWFEFKGKTFWSKIKAETYEEAKEKTLEKWELKRKGFWTFSEARTCGMCNRFSCYECLLYDVNSTCTPYSENPELQIQWLKSKFLAWEEKNENNK